MPYLTPAVRNRNIPTPFFHEEFDLFNRPNGSGLGKTNTGQTWVPLLGVWGIKDKKAYQVSGPNPSLAVIETTFKHYTVTCELTVDPSHPAGVTIRCKDVSNRVDIYLDGTTVFIHQIVAGVIAEVTTPLVWVAGDVLTIACRTTDIKILQNGIQKVETDLDLGLQLNSKVGLYGSGLASRWDNLTVDSILVLT